MRRRLLLSLIVAAVACLGAECDGSSSSSNAPAAQERVDTQPPGPSTPTPEPSAALIFGAALITAFALRRRDS